MREAQRRREPSLGRLVWCAVLFVFGIYWLVCSARLGTYGMLPFGIVAALLGTLVLLRQIRLFVRGKQSSGRKRD